MKKQKVTIISTGAPNRTRIYNVDGKLIPGVISVEWKCNCKDKFATATLVVHADLIVKGVLNKKSISK